MLKMLWLFTALNFGVFMTLHNKASGHAVPNTRKLLTSREDRYPQFLQLSVGYNSKITCWWSRVFKKGEPAVCGCKNGPKPPVGGTKKSACCPAVAYKDGQDCAGHGLCIAYSDRRSDAEKRKGLKYQGMFLEQQEVMLTMKRRDGNEWSSTQDAGTKEDMPAHGGGNLRRAYSSSGMLETLGKIGYIFITSIKLREKLNNDGALMCKTTAAADSPSLHAKNRSICMGIANLPKALKQFSNMYDPEKVHSHFREHTNTASQDSAFLQTSGVGSFPEKLYYTTKQIQRFLGEDEMNMYLVAADKNFRYTAAKTDPNFYIWDGYPGQARCGKDGWCAKCVCEEGWSGYGCMYGERPEKGVVNCNPLDPSVTCAEHTDAPVPPCMGPIDQYEMTDPCASANRRRQPYPPSEPPEPTPYISMPSFSDDEGGEGTHKDE